MKLEGSHDLPYPRDAVWTAILDPEVLSRTMPGCQKLEKTDEHTMTGILKVQIGPVTGLFKGTLELTEVDPPNGYRMNLQGQGPAGFMKGEGEIRLEDAGDRTRLTYDLDAQVGGRIAGVGQRLLDRSAKVITEQGLEGLERQLAARHAPEPTGAPATEGASSRRVDAPLPPAPSQTDFALRFARGMFEETVAPEHRSLVIATVAFFVGVLFGALLRRP